MNFREELAKELKLGAIAEATMLNDYVKACEAIAVRYHESEVKKLHIQNVVGRSEQLICPICGLDGFEDQADLDIHLEDCED